ncbi:MAG: hypothetical protein J6M17_04375 [Ruminococcus sp.]|nr:hypothetical protein [Ruminococcus sp.]MBP3271448.1 hypothetical protein [Ruminococcus sp.]
MVKCDPDDNTRIIVPDHPADSGSRRLLFGGTFVIIGAVLFAVSKISE